MAKEENEKEKNKPKPCPKWLNDTAKKEWRRVAKILAEEGKDFTDKDLKALEAYCINYAMFLNQHVALDHEKGAINKSGTKLTGEAANTQDISYNIENYGALVPIANDLQEDEAVNIVQDVIKPDFAEAGVNSENDEILQIVEDNATDKSTGVTDWRGVKKVIDGVLPTLRAKTVVITNLTGYVYLQSQEDKNGRNLDLVKTVNGKDYFQNRQLITLSDEAVTASATGKVVFYVVNLYALVKFFERKGYTVSTDKSVFFESDETALKVQERFDCEKLDDRADFKVEFTPAA